MIMYLIQFLIGYLILYLLLIFKYFSDKYCMLIKLALDTIRSIKFSYKKLIINNWREKERNCV